MLDADHFALRTRCVRPRNRSATNRFDELSPSHGAPRQNGIVLQL
jgi:hypothetical protein